MRNWRWHQSWRCPWRVAVRPNLPPHDAGRRSLGMTTINSYARGMTQHLQGSASQLCKFAMPKIAKLQNPDFLKFALLLSGGARHRSTMTPEG